MISGRISYSTATNKLGYFVERTVLGKNLPVYTDFRDGGNTCYTILRRINGDLSSLLADLKVALMKPLAKDSPETMNKLQKKWKIREDLGQIWIHGRHTDLIRKFLEEKGF